MYIPKEDRGQFIITMVIAFFMFCLLARGAIHQDHQENQFSITYEGMP